jgi:hypothetical protein
LGALAKDNADVARVGHAVAMRVAAEDAHLTCRRQEDTRQHLNRRRFARAIDADVADDLPRLDGEADVLDRRLRLVARPEQMPHSPGQARLFVGNAIDFRQVLSVNHRGPHS